MAAVGGEVAKNHRDDFAVGARPLLHHDGLVFFIPRIISRQAPASFDYCCPHAPVMSNDSDWISSCPSSCIPYRNIPATGFKLACQICSLHCNPIIAITEQRHATKSCTYEHDSAETPANAGGWTFGSIRLRADPPINLNAKDLKDITNLAGRVPGLHEYKITLINESIMFPGCYNVCVRNYVIYMIRDMEWRVYKVGGSIP